jgi:hypothetical protein
MSGWIEHKPKAGEENLRIWHRIFTPPAGGNAEFAPLNDGHRPRPGTVVRVYVLICVNLETRRTNGLVSLSQTRPDTFWDATVTLTDGRTYSIGGSDFNERGCQQKITRAITKKWKDVIGGPTEFFLPGGQRFR